MKIKRYLDKDMRNVLRRVREEQGPDAVILSNRRVDDGIEVIAAIDYDEALVRHALGSERNAGPAIDGDARDDTKAAATRREPAAEVVAAKLDAQPLEAIGQATKAPSPDVLRGVQNEISSLRGLVETQLSGLVWKDATRRFPLRTQILRNLARIGIAPDIASIIVDRLEPIDDVRNIWQAPLAMLARTLPVTDDDLMRHGGVAALIGPTGVGKTTTIAKIAAQYAMHQRADDIALVSADAYRIGAREHLMAFANIIGAKVHLAGNSDELKETLMRLEHKKLVLIDTEGRSQRDHELQNRFATWGRHRDRVRYYLTLSAATQEAGLDEVVRVFNTVPLSGCIVTKIDEAAQLGCVISTLIRHDLPVTWLADGQRIPDDLHAADRRRLWFVNQAVECLECSQPKVDERTMAENYAEASVAHA